MGAFAILATTQGLMAIVPTVRCSRIADSVEFYSKVLDFECVEAESQTDPAFAVLKREGDTLFLSSHRGDGVFGQAVAVLVPEVDALFEKFKARGLEIRKSNSEVHNGPTNQTWGTREFYVDDPDGNTLRFIAEVAST